MNKIKQILISGTICVISLFASCKYLDVVPDNELKLEDIYRSRSTAYDGLAKMYYYLPEDHRTHQTSWSLGNDWVGRLDIDVADVNSSLPAIRLMRGLQSSSNVYLNIWSGGGGSRSAHVAIRCCNIFLDYIDGIPNMGEKERNDWRAQAKFLKAYYHFLLLRQYGPIIISDKMVDLDAVSSDLFQYRSKVEDCFDHILKWLDEAIPDLYEERQKSDLGMIDRTGAMAIKARVLLYRASPFYTGNTEYFSDFFDHDGQTYFLMDQSEETRKKRWKEAADAADEAINSALKCGKGLYTYEKEVPYLYDTLSWRVNHDNMKTLYDLRMVVVDPFNKEGLWVYSNIDVVGLGDEIQNSSNMRVPYDDYDGNNVDVSNSFSWQWMCASYNVAAKYYTKNGLPIDEDPTFDTNTMFDITYTPSMDESDYIPLNGIMQPSRETVKFNMDREPRFYANLAITAGYFRTQFVRIRTMMYKNEEGGHMDEHVAKINQRYDYYCTGIGVQKIVHPESKSAAWQRVVRFPYPIIRMADLYLMKAEALNEYLDAPNQEVWEAVDVVRARAGIPDVNTSWSMASKNPNKHFAKEGMRDIILRERAIELAFEGHNFWDMYRHKKAVSEFSVPVYGWKAEGENAADFFNLQPKQTRQFSERDYLWPLTLNELNTNGNLKQNPGW